MYPDCLKDLVGIGDIGCGGYKVANDLSTSGLFVTQDPTYDHARFQSGDSECELAKLMIKMREEAYRQITTDIGAILAPKIQVKTESFYDVGQTTPGAYLPSSRIPAKPFVRIQTDLREGASIEINKVALYLTPFTPTAFDLDLRIVRESDEAMVKTFTFSIAGYSKRYREVTPFQIPCDGDSYRVEYTYNPSLFMVPEIYYHCGCGDRIKNALGFMKEQRATDGTAAMSYGIHIPVKLVCDGSRIICALLKNSVYRNVIGYMIRKKVIDLTLQNIYYRQDVNKFTLLTPDDMSAQIERYQAEYNARLEWLRFENGFDVDGFCLSCSGGMRKISLLTNR